MSEFNIHRYNKDRYLAEAGLGSSQAQTLSTLIFKSIDQVDESLSYRDLALAIGIILKDGYGEHNFEPFMEVLHTELGMGETINEENDNVELTDLFTNKFNVRTTSMDFGDSGKLTIYVKDVIEDSKFDDMIKFMEDYGYNVDREQSINYYEHEPQERRNYPRIIFKK